MTNLETGERLYHCAPSDPLQNVPAALERLGLPPCSHCFTVNHIEADAETLIVAPDALILYCKPLHTGVSLGGEEYGVIRNQVLSRLDGKLVVVTNDFMFRSDMPLIPVGQEITSESDNEPAFEQLLDRLSLLVDCVRTEDLLDLSTTSHISQRIVH